MDQSLFDSVLKATKDYWFLITLVGSVLLTIGYMIMFRVNPWDQQRSAKLRRDRVRFHNSVGYTLVEAGHFKEAQSEFEEALKLAAEDQTALNGKYLTNLFINIASSTADPAIGFAIQHHMSETALKREQHLHIIDKYLGDLHTRIANVSKANEYYESALRKKPDYPDALYTMGWQYYQHGSDIDGMERMFRKLTEVDPYDYRGYHGLGYALYMKALRETDVEKRDPLMTDAAAQSSKAKDLVFYQLNIVMDFGEVARTVDPELSLAYHNYGRKILTDPAMSETGDNPYPLLARMLTSDGELTIDAKNDKLAWVTYQIALDHLAMERLFDDEKAGAEHTQLMSEAENLDASKLVRYIYDDQLRILDMLLPAKEDE
jgi:tetratricopeptide (TPR) repeat protein